MFEPESRRMERLQRDLSDITDTCREVAVAIREIDPDAPISELEECLSQVPPKNSESVSYDGKSFYVSQATPSSRELVDAVVARKRLLTTLEEKRAEALKQKDNARKASLPEIELLREEMYERFKALEAQIRVLSIRPSQESSPSSRTLQRNVAVPPMCGHLSTSGDPAFSSDARSFGGVRKVGQGSYASDVPAVRRVR